MISSSGKTPRLLAAATDAAVLSQLKAALEAEKVLVYEAADGDSCQQAFARVQPDLLLIDGAMAGAVEICRSVKAAPDLAHVRVILILKAESDGELAVFEQAEADEYITLPLRMPVLMRRVKALLHEQELEADSEFRSAIMSQMGDAVVAVDANSSVIYWNAEAERSYGLRSDEIIGQPLDKAYTDRLGRRQGDPTCSRRSGARLVARRRYPPLMDGRTARGRSRGAAVGSASKSD